MAEEDFTELLQETASRLIGRTSRWELPDPVVKHFAGQTAAAVNKTISLLGVDDPAGELKAAFGVDPNATPGMQADQISHAISAAVDAVWPELSADDAFTETRPLFGSKAEPRDDHLCEEVGKHLDELLKDNPEPFEEFEAFEAEAGSTDDDTARPSRWTLDRVKTILTRMLAFSREVDIDDPERAVKYPHRIRFEDSLALEIELMRLDSRVELAKTFAEQARQNPDFRSPGRSIGNDVHTELQDRYLMARSDANKIVQESWVYLPGRRRRRTISEQAERELREHDPDYTFAVVEMARLPKRGRLSGKYRWDTLDLSLAQLYEIKPLVRMHEGVLQESYYRYKYCFSTLYLLDLNSRILVPWIDPGEVFPVKHPWTNELLIHTRFGALALPLNVMQVLPGVVPYVVLSRNKHTDMVRLLQRVMAWLRETYKAIKKKMQQIRALILIGILVLFIFTLIIIFVLAKALKETTQPPKQLPPPGEQPVPPIGEPSREPVFSPRSLGISSLISIQPAPDYKSLRIIVDKDSDRSGTVRFGIGGLEIEGLPISHFGEVMTRVVDGIDIALTELTRMPPPEPDALLS